MKNEAGDTIAVALSRANYVINPYQAVEIAEVVLRAVADHTEKVEPFARGTIRDLRDAAETLNGMADDQD